MVGLTQVEQQGGLPQHKQIETEWSAGRPPTPPANVNECSRSRFYQSAQWTVAEFPLALGEAQTPPSQDKQADKKQTVSLSLSLPRSLSLSYSPSRTPCRNKGTTNKERMKYKKADDWTEAATLQSLGCSQCAPRGQRGAASHHLALDCVAKLGADIHSRHSTSGGGEIGVLEEEEPTPDFGSIIHQLLLGACLQKFFSFFLLLIFLCLIFLACQRVQNLPCKHSGSTHMGLFCLFFFSSCSFLPHFLLFLGSWVEGGGLQNPRRLELSLSACDALSSFSDLCGYTS